jgi:dynein heavy chain
MDYEFWYDRQKIVPNYIQDFQILSAMGKPGGGRAEISNRILSKFHVINYTIPSEVNMKRIFDTIAQFKFAHFDEEIKNLSEPLAIATINLFNIIQEQFLPTPAKSHYVFNMRDVSKVFQGLYQADKNFYEGKEHIVKLWSHEVLRVFQDRLNSYDDRDKFKQHVNEQLEQIFQMNYVEHCSTNGEDCIFVDFMGEYENQAIYEECTNFQKLRDYLNEKLVAYNMQPKISKMDIVLFKDAITHIAKIYRVLNLKRGHAFLVGVGGSGRHSLTRMSAFLSKMNVYQLEVFKGFNLKNFREFLKVMYEVAAYKGKDKLKTVFIFSDNDVVHESFLEDIQNMLNGGVVPNIYIPDEMNQIREGIRKKFKKDMPAGTVETPEALTEFFFNGVKDHLHLSICMSPIGQAFRDYCRMYPALINNTTIDWFMGWPEDALTEVAMKFIGEMGLETNIHAGLSVVCSYAH